MRSSGNQTKDFTVPHWKRISTGRGFLSDTAADLEACHSHGCPAEGPSTHHSHPVWMWLSTQVWQFCLICYAMAAVLRHHHCPGVDVCRLLCCSPTADLHAIARIPSVHTATHHSELFSGSAHIVVQLHQVNGLVIQ